MQTALPHFRTPPTPQEYTGLKTLYLEQNALSVIENLGHLAELRCLYMGKNVIAQARAGAGALPHRAVGAARGPQ